jgi:hypothetical protein
VEVVHMSAKDTQKAQRVEHGDTAETIDAGKNGDLEEVGTVLQETRGSILGSLTDTGAADRRFG